jgi:hypothetical protein
MTRKFALPVMLALMIGACGDGGQSNQPPIKVRSAEQDRLHTLDALNLAIALKRAIQSAGYTCRRVTNAGFVAAYKNLDMWMATCEEQRDWAIFAGPDGSAQVRDCKDVPGTGLPVCRITKAPKGTFDGQ